MLNLKFTSEFLAPNSLYLMPENIPIYQFLPQSFNIWHDRYNWCCCMLHMKAVRVNLKTFHNKEKNSISLILYLYDTKLIVIIILSHFTSCLVCTHDMLRVRDRVATFDHEGEHHTYRWWSWRMERLWILSYIIKHPHRPWTAFL